VFSGCGPELTHNTVYR